MDLIQGTIDTITTKGDYHPPKRLIDKWTGGGEGARHSLLNSHVWELRSTGENVFAIGATLIELYSCYKGEL